MYALPTSNRLLVAVFMALTIIFCFGGTSALAQSQRVVAVSATARTESSARSAAIESRHARATVSRVCASHTRSHSHHTRSHQSSRCREARHLLADVQARATRLRVALSRLHREQASHTTSGSSGSSSPTGSAPTQGGTEPTQTGTGGPASTESSGSATGTATTPTTGAGSTVGPTQGHGSGGGVEESLPVSGSNPESTGPDSPLGGGEETSGSTTQVQTGIDSGMEANDYTATTQLGAKLVRIEWTIGTTAAQMQPVIASYAAIGVRVLPLVSFYGTLPTPTPAQAKSLAGWAQAYGPGGTFWSNRKDGQLAIQSIEFGNETSYGYQYGDSAESASYTVRAQNYALRLKEAAEAISTTGVKVGLLAQADDWTGNWVNGMFSAVPNLGSYVAGWTIHPYGISWEGRLQDLLAQTAAHGAPSDIPIDITEWGVASDNGRCLSDNDGWNKCMTDNEAASTLTNTFSGVQRVLGSRFGMFVLYQVRDQEPTAATSDNQAYFGAMQHELQPKGAYTRAVEKTLAGV